MKGLSLRDMTIKTRFAPSPTGALHLGHVYAARQAFRRARDAGGEFLLRLEDIDASRCRPDYAAAILDDLAWLGLAWDGAVRVQSAHLAAYARALDRLAALGLLYPCFCTRADIAQAGGAPHGAGLVYPGTCRDLSPAVREARIASGAAYALRLDVRRAGAPGLRFFEETAGWVAVVPELLGDVVLARRDFPASYHLCVVHDDAVQGISHVTRGQDLADATHVHVLLQHLLGLPTPVYAHHKLLTDAAGRRLAKRDKSFTVAAMRAAGALPGDVFATLDRCGAMA